jgi:hypothetical protein
MDFYDPLGLGDCPQGKTCGLPPNYNPGNPGNGCAPGDATCGGDLFGARLFGGYCIFRFCFPYYGFWPPDVVGGRGRRDGGFSFGVSIVGGIGAPSGAGETLGVPGWMPFPVGSLADFLPELPKGEKIGDRRDVLSSRRVPLDKSEGVVKHRSIMGDA